MLLGIRRRGDGEKGVVVEDNMERSGDVGEEGRLALA